VVGSDNQQIAIRAGDASTFAVLERFGQRVGAKTLSLSSAV